MMTVGSIFTGIGGLDRGFESEGFQVIWMVKSAQSSPDASSASAPAVSRE